jgi:hypothetical protein
MVWGAVGLVVPLIMLSSIGRLLERSLGIRAAIWMDAIWPSSFWLLATSGGENTWEAYEIVAFAVAANVLFYGIVGAVFWGLKHAVTKVIRR